MPEECIFCKIAAGEIPVKPIYQDEQLLGRFDLSATEHRQTLSGMHLNNADACVLKIKALRGTADIEALITETDA